MGSIDPSDWDERRFRRNRGQIDYTNPPAAGSLRDPESNYPHGWILIISFMGKRIMPRILDLSLGWRLLAALTMTVLSIVNAFELQSIELGLVLFGIITLTTLGFTFVASYALDGIALRRSEHLAVASLGGNSAAFLMYLTLASKAAHSSEQDIATIATFWIALILCPVFAYVACSRIRTIFRRQTDEWAVKHFSR